MAFKESLFDKALLSRALHLKCPRCGEGDVFKKSLLPEMHKNCSHCGLDLSKNDSADGPSFILTFILGFLIVPLALWVEFKFEPPLWVHAAMAAVFSLVFIFGTLKPLKCWVMAVQYRHRPGDWDK